jgi:hypothetical protein
MHSIITPDQRRSHVESVSIYEAVSIMILLPTDTFVDVVVISVKSEAYGLIFSIPPPGTRPRIHYVDQNQKTIETLVRKHYSVATTY